MLSIRHALVVAALAVMFAPAGSASASIDGPATVRKLATDSAKLLGDELELVTMLDGQDVAPADLESTQARLRDVDRQGQVLLRELQGIGVSLTPAIETTLDRLPAPTVAATNRPVRLAPLDVVYEAAIADLARIAATPGAVAAVANGGQGPSYPLLLVAAVSLLVLGTAALANTLWRRPESEELAAMAWSDGLTGLANRRRLDADLASQERDKGPTAVIMLDVDHFKAVNEAHGHQVGDEVLRQLSALLTKQVRRDDVVYRYGGEEFCVLLRDADNEDARAVADRIVEAARTITLPDSDHVTVSVGVARTEGIEFVVAVDNADRALFIAKREGRDRAVHAAERDLVDIV